MIPVFVQEDEIKTVMFLSECYQKLMKQEYQLLIVVYGSSRLMGVSLDWLVRSFSRIF